MVDDATRTRWQQEVERELCGPRAVAAWRTWQATWAEWTRPLTIEHERIHEVYEHE